MQPSPKGKSRTPIFTKSLYHGGSVMSKPRFGWWSYAKYMVRVYPERKKEYQDIQSQRITREITAVSGGTTASRSTENAALKQMSPAKQAEYDAVAKAIEATKLMYNGKEHLALINMVFWRKSHNIDGAAYALNYSTITGERFHRDFLRLVGLYRGLCDAEEVESQFGI